MGAEGDTIVVPKDSKIKDVGDLEGKKVAVAKGSSANYNLLAQLDKAGADFDKVDVKYLQPADALAAFSAGHVDAWAIWDPYTAQAEVDEDAQGDRRRRRGLVNGMVFQAANPDCARGQGHGRRAQGLRRRIWLKPRCGATPTASSGRRSGPRRPGSLPR